MSKFILLLLIIHCSLLIAQTPTQEWVNRFTWANYASGISVKQDSTGNIYVLMKLYTDSTLNDFGLLKLNSSGNIIWNTYYNSPGNFSDNPVAFDVGSQGNIYIAGVSSINFTNRITTVKFNSNGILQWAKVYDGGGLGDSPGDIILDKTGNVIVVGGSSDNNNQSFALIVKYNSEGDLLWVRKFNQLPQSSWNWNVIIDDSNNIYTTGYYETTLADYLILKYNTTGNLSWYTLYDSPQNLNDIGYFIVNDSNNNIYVVGSSYVFGSGLNNNLVKLNSNGIIQWGRVFTGVISGNGQCGSEPKGLAVTNNANSIYYTTECYGNQTLTEIVTLKYTSFGDSVWVKRYNGDGISGRVNGPSFLKLDKYNDIYISGRAYFQGTGDDFITIKYLSGGTQQWVTKYNGPLTNSFDYAYDLITDNNLNVYVTGISNRNTVALWDAVTIKYSQPDGVHQISNNIPDGFKLEQNYPNPFNSQTKINFGIPRNEEVKIIVNDIIGREVETLVNKELKPGIYEARWYADKFSSGVYFYTLITKTYRETKKAILIK